MVPICERSTMTIRALIDALRPMEPEKDAFVALFKLEGTGELFDIEVISDHEGHAQLEIYEEEDEEPVADETEPA
jgi:hypothetical protein